MFSAAASEPEPVIDDSRLDFDTAANDASNGIEFRKHRDHFFMLCYVYVME